jgi:hypothetical protein
MTQTIYGVGTELNDTDDLWRWNRAKWPTFARAWKLSSNFLHVYNIHDWPHAIIGHLLSFDTDKLFFSRTSGGGGPLSNICCTYCSRLAKSRFPLYFAEPEPLDQKNIRLYRQAEAGNEPDRDKQKNIQPRKYMHLSHKAILYKLKHANSIIIHYPWQLELRMWIAWYQTYAQNTSHFCQ